jgi:hypothetical protein
MDLRTTSLRRAPILASALVLGLGACGGSTASGPEADARPAATVPPFIVLHESDDATILLDPRGRFVNLVLPPGRMAMLGADSWSFPRGQIVARTLFQAFDDEFDFLMVAFADGEGESVEQGRTVRAASRIPGLGLHLGDRTRRFGSDGRLVALLMTMEHRHFDTRMPIHELAHLWGQYAIDRTGSGSHWGFTEVGGQLGGWERGTLQHLGNGTWVARGPGMPAGFSLTSAEGPPLPYAPMELYLMGVLPPDSVAPFQVARGARWVSEEAGIFQADRIDVWTVEDLIERHGPRRPAWPDAPTEFRGLYAVISAEPLDDGTRDQIDRDVEDFARPGPRRHRTYLNFWEATGGRATIVMDRLHETVREGR